MAATLNRRRFIGISASAAGLALLPFGSTGAAEANIVTWRGQALGAPATLIIHHEDRSLAERLVGRMVSEIARLERIFSLYRQDSILSELNLVGAIVAPPIELVDLLEASRTFWAVTGGAFDPTVQPLWMLYARHFSTPDADPAGPPADRFAETLKLVGFDNVRVSRDRIAFSRPGMALTLNGIAQGYITDRIIDLLREGGVANTMVNMGEIRSLGNRPDDTPWRVALADPRGTEIELTDRAVAASSPSGFVFDEAGRFNHLLDPRSGSAAGRWSGVSVVAPDATTADAFATSFSLMQADAIAAVTRSHAGLTAYLLDDRENTLVL